MTYLFTFNQTITNSDVCYHQVHNWADVRSSCHFVVITFCPHLISIILPLMIPFFVPLCLIPQLLSVHQPIFQSSWHRLSLHSSSCSASHATLCEATQPSSIHILKPLPLTSATPSASLSFLDPLTQQRLLVHYWTCCGLCSHQQLIKVPSLLESSS